MESTQAAVNIQYVMSDIFNGSDCGFNGEAALNISPCSE